MARIIVSNEKEVVDAVRAARESNRTFEIVGAGTKRGYGRPLECDDVLDVSGLRGVQKYEPDELVVTALAGTPVAEIEAALAEKNQRLGFEPADWGRLFGAPPNCATIGGVLAADASGSAAVKFGRARDHLLGFRAVNGFGEAYKAGGRVVKNVTGFDLPKLMCGAMGTLGPMTEVTLRVFPRPLHAVTFATDEVSMEDGLALLRRAWSSALEATGLAFQNGRALIRLEGSAATLREKEIILRGLFARELHQVQNGDESFRAIASGRTESRTTLWRVHISPSNTAALISVLQPETWCADWAGALVWAGCRQGSNIRTVTKQLDALCIMITDDESVPPFEPQDRIRSELTQNVKAAFDPLRIFNPGRMWEDI
jgi:glycolate oxidase FAD binding subunit